MRAKVVSACQVPQKPGFLHQTKAAAIVKNMKVSAIIGLYHGVFDDRYSEARSDWETKAHDQHNSVYRRRFRR